MLNNLAKNMRRRRFAIEQLELRHPLAVVISEFVALSSDVELYNADTPAIDISSWEISNGLNAYALPPNTPLLQPGEYRHLSLSTLLAFSMNQRLDPQNSLELWDSNDNLIQDLGEYPAQVPDTSYGTVHGTEGNNPTYRVYERYTLGEVNGYLRDITPTGLYDTSFTLSLDADLLGPNDKVSYRLITTDDLVEEYEFPGDALPTVSETSTLRFEIEVDGQTKERGVRTYLFEDTLISDVAAVENRTLSTAQQDDLKAAFGALPQLYVTAYDNNDIPNVPSEPNDPEVISSIEFLDFNVQGQLESRFQHDSAIEPHGNSCPGISGIFVSKKPCFRLTFKPFAESGVRELPFDLFPSSDYPVFDGGQFNDRTIDQIVLRSSNQDGLYAGGQGTYVRDEAARETMRQMGGLVAHQRPATLFVNGQYEGLYYMSERISGDYLASYLGGDDSEFSLVRTVQNVTPGIQDGSDSVGGAQDWIDFFDNVVSGNLIPGSLNVNSSFYAQVDQHVDLDNLIDFVLVNQLFKHVEFYNGFNWFGSRTTETKWQFHIWDVENARVDNTPVLDTLNANDHLDAQNKVKDIKKHPFYLHTLLMQTDDYREQLEARLLNRISAAVGTSTPLSYGGILHRAEGLFTTLDTAIRGEIVRYPDATEADWLLAQADLLEVASKDRSELILDYAVILPNVLNVDFENDDMLNIADIDSFASDIRAGNVQLGTHDLNFDNEVDEHDLAVLVIYYVGTFVGDSNFDGLFNSSDFVWVITAGRYETGLEAHWEEGDWNGDGVFDSSDHVFALLYGGYQ